MADADPAAPTDGPAKGAPERSPSDIDPGDRGELTVLDKAVEHIADASLSRTTGVSTASSGALGRRASRVSVSKTGDVVRSTADLTVRWPMSAPRVADDVRQDIARGMTSSSLAVDDVDVHVGNFAIPPGLTLDTPRAADGHVVPTRRPLARPAATPIAVVLAVVFIAAGAALVRDGLVELGALAGSSWSTAAVDWFDGLTPQSWMTPAGIAVGVVGLLLVLASLKWRARRHRPVDGVAEVWVRPTKTKKSEPETVDTPPTLVTDTATTGTDKSASTDSTSGPSITKETV